MHPLYREVAICVSVTTSNNHIFYDNYRNVCCSYVYHVTKKQPVKSNIRSNQSAKLWPYGRQFQA